MLFRRMQFWNKNKLKCLFCGCILVFICEYLGAVRHLLETDYHSKYTYPLDVDIQELIGTLKQGQKPTVPFINEYPYRFKIKNEKKCKTSDGQNYQDILLLFVIKSAIPNSERRTAIRNSWGWEHRFSDVSIRRVFMLGDSINDPLIQDLIDTEQAKFNDIVQANFIDNYYNNTIKTMMSFKWVVSNCPKAQYIMFSDDDMYISTKNLLKFIRNPFGIPLGFRKRLLWAAVDIHTDEKHELFLAQNITSKDVLYRTLNNKDGNSFNSQFLIQNSLQNDQDRKLLGVNENRVFDGRLFAGYVFATSPIRNKLSKWYVSLEEYPYSKYPPYITAGAYVVSNIALLDLYYTSLYTKHFRFDDVYLGIVAKKAGIEPLHNENFYFWKKSYNPQGYSDVVASHGFGNPKELQKVWEEQRSLGHA